MDELVFEELGFRSLCVADSPSLVHLYEARRRHSRSQYSLVVDCGFSFTHAAPEVHNFTLNYGIRCLDLCGKAFTNYLKELVSYRSVNLMDETLIIDHAKEKLCFVSLDVSRDLRLASDPPNDNEENMGKTPSSARHTRGCNCKKSLCLKKYCECYQAGVGCSFGCRCEGCKNTFGRRDGKFSFSGCSLHHIGDTLNPYEQVISIIGRTLSTFDEDNLIPCFGFGDDHVMDFKML